MPTAVTHQLLAEEVFRALPDAIRREISSLPHYYFGAQGCDVCFAYKVLGAENENLGRFLHARQPLLFFRILFEEARKSRQVRSYAYGYITHYAADTVFHPYIYEEKGGENTLRHHAVEHAYDGVLLKQYRGEGLFLYRLPNPRDISLHGVYKVYARYARESGWGELEEPSFERAVARYYAFNFFRTPFYRRKNAARAEELFGQAKERSLALSRAFYGEKTGNFAAEDFGRHYLSGKIV